MNVGEPCLSEVPRANTQGLPHHSPSRYILAGVDNCNLMYLHRLEQHFSPTSPPAPHIEQSHSTYGGKNTVLILVRVRSLPSRAIVKWWFLFLLAAPREGECATERRDASLEVTETVLSQGHRSTDQKVSFCFPYSFSLALSATLNRVVSPWGYFPSWSFFTLGATRIRCWGHRRPILA